MKPQLIITSITEIENNIRLAKTEGFITTPAHIAFRYEIDIQGTGNFNDYLNNDKSFNKEKLAMDILEGRISMVGLASMV